jgi:hypothetical protein
MRIESFRVVDYKSFVNSGTLHFEPRPASFDWSTALSASEQGIFQQPALFILPLSNVLKCYKLLRLYPRSEARRMASAERADLAHRFWEEGD